MQTRKHIHLIGICGTAMASLAGMLQVQGHRITGSDAAAYPPMSDLLAAWGFRFMSRMRRAIWSRGRTWWWWAMRSRAGMWSWSMCWMRGFRSVRWRAILHDEFLPGRESLVVAGTHGKTTTTSMLAWIYEVASRTGS